MPRWLRKALPRIHEQAKGRRVRFTYKALVELASLELGLDRRRVPVVDAKLQDVLGQNEDLGRLASLGTEDVALSRIRRDLDPRGLRALVGKPQLEVAAT